MKQTCPDSLHIDSLHTLKSQNILYHWIVNWRICFHRYTSLCLFYLQIFFFFFSNWQNSVPQVLYSPFDDLYGVQSSSFQHLSNLISISKVWKDLANNDSFKKSFKSLLPVSIKSDTHLLIISFYLHAN